MNPAFNRPAAASPENAVPPALPGLLVGALVIESVASVTLSRAITYGRDWLVPVHFISLIAVVIAALAVHSLRLWSRLTVMAALLFVAAILLAILPFTGDSGLAWLGLGILAAVQGAQLLATAIGAGLALESRPHGVRLAAVFGCAAGFAACVLVAASLLAVKLNPDIQSLAVSGTLAGVAAALAAAAALVWLALRRAAFAPANRPPRPTAAAGPRSMWAADSPGMMATAYLIQLSLTIGVTMLGSYLAIWRGGDLAKVAGTMAWLAPAVGVVALFVGAILADGRRRGGRNPAAIALWAAGAALILCLVALTVDDAFQSIVLLAIATGTGAAAWGPALVTVNDRTAPRYRVISVLLLVVFLGQLEFIGLPYLFDAIGLKLAGADGWTFDGGFWGHLVFNHRLSNGAESSTVNFLLPLKIDADLGDADGAIVVMRTAAILVTLALIGPIILYRLAGRSPPRAAVASAAFCQSCGAQNEPQDRYCQACGDRLAVAPMPDAGAHTHSLMAMLLGLGGGALVAILAVAADAEGLFHEKWTAAIVWKGAPQAVDDAIKACKAAPCLFDALKANHAPAETIKFVKMLQNDAPSDELGYPTNFHGEGRVRAAELFIPGLGMDGSLGFVFVNGTRAAVRPTDDIATAATADPAYRNLKMQYPNVTPWDGLTFRKEVVGGDGSQQFQFGETLLNGCHACAVLGTLVIGYDFDGRGHYTGMAIVGVEADENAPFSALLDRLSQESAFDQTFSQLQPDGRVATVSKHTGLGVPIASTGTRSDRCRLALDSNGQAFSGGDYLIDNAFEMKGVIIQTAAAAAAATAAPAPGLTNPLAPPAPAPSPPTNSIVISCLAGGSCISQDSVGNGRGAPSPRIDFLVPQENVDAVIRDFETLQTMCSR